MQEESQVTQVVKDLYSSQELAVLATHREEQPYTSLMAFAATDDLRHLVFATDRDTRKYSNLIADPRVALLVDNRSKTDMDLQETIAVTAIGEAEELGEAEKDAFLRLYLAKHSQLREFVTSPTCSLFRVKVDKYHIVTKFQTVQELQPK